MLLRRRRELGLERYPIGPTASACRQRTVLGRGHDDAVRWIRLLPWLPAAVMALVLWLWVWSVFDFASDAQENIDLLWQSLGSGLLNADPLGGLRVLHIQPPLLNGLFAIDLAITGQSHLFMMTVNLLAMLGSIILLGDALRRIGLPWWLTVACTAVLALLPGTVAYSMWVYTVTLTSFFAMAAVWGTSLIGKRPVMGAAASSLGMLGLALTRSTFAFPVLVVWIVAVSFLSWRRGARSGLLISLGVLGLAGILQLHYFVNFGLVTMNSWGGQYLINASRTSGVLQVSDATRARIMDKPCDAAVWQAFEKGQLNLWDPGGLFVLPACSSVEIPAETGRPAWDEQFRPENGELNLNWRYGLAASKVWQGIALEIVRGDPSQFLRMAVSPPGGFAASGVARYLSDSRDYPWVQEAAGLLPGTRVSFLLWAGFAPAAWIIVLGGWLGAAVSGSWRRRTSVAYWMGSAFLVFHITASTLLEYAEAMRFRSEVDPVLVFVSGASLWYAFSWAKARRVSSGAGTSPGSEER